MKKIYSLLAAMCIALCANATDLTFEVEVHDNIVTVTPSVDDEPYFCAPLDQEDLDFYAGLSFFDLTDPYDLFLLASGAYNKNFFKGVSTLACHNGNHILVMCGCEKDETGLIVPKGEVYTMPITINIDIDEPVFDPLTFTVECDNDRFTVTPSDDVQEYSVAVFTQHDVEELDSIGSSVESRMKARTILGLIKDKIYKGTSFHTLDGEVEKINMGNDDHFVIVIMGVKTDVDRYVITTPVYQFGWVVDRNTTGIHDIKAPTRIAKMLKDGKIILNGSVLLDGLSL